MPTERTLIFYKQIIIIYLQVYTSKSTLIQQVSYCRWENRGEKKIKRTYTHEVIACVGPIYQNKDLIPPSTYVHDPWLEN